MARRPAALPAVLKYSRTSASSLIEMWTFQTVCRRPVSPRRHGGHGDFTEASGFSVHLRVLRVSYDNTFSAVISSPYLHLLAGLDRRKRIFIRYGEPQAHGNSVVKRALEFFLSLASHNTPAPPAKRRLTFGNASV